MNLEINKSVLKSNVPQSPDPTQVDSRPVINYPTRKPFQRYLEESVNPKIRDDLPSLTKREQPDYLKCPQAKGNPFRFISYERISQLKDREKKRKDEELKRFESARQLSEKIPLRLRQRNTAASNVRQLIHEENLSELDTHGRLFGPNSLTAQPVNSKFIELQPVPRVTSQIRTASVRMNEDCIEPKATVEDKKSFDAESDSRDPPSRMDGDHGSIKSITDNNEAKTKAKSISEPRPTKSHDGVKTFVRDRRRLCLLELALRTKQGEVKRLDAILKAEDEFLRREEHELLRRHEEHDRYLKTICQRTAEAIRLAEAEARKRNDLTDRIKRARYRLAHLNAECVKLEEEFIRLNNYKEFLRKVANTFREHHTQMRPPASQLDGPLSLESDGLHSVPVDSVDDDATLKRSLAELTTTPIQGHSSSQSTECDNVSLIEFFTSPQDLVDILAELESNNLTLIENVQEQEEVCERVRAKANKLHALLNVERNMVDKHIEREKQNINGIRENTDSISVARETLSEFVLLERYAKVFHLGDMEQFEHIDTDLLLSAPPSKGPVTKAGKLHIGTEQTDSKPTISDLLEILQCQIQKVYSSVYGTNEGGARLDTLVMLRRLETTVDELSEMLNAYPKHLVIRAKRTVDERNRVTARRRQKVEGRLAYERRLQKAILKAREGPRWKFGRRVIVRSRPPEVKRVVHVGAVATESEEDNKSLFVP